ncbi:MAG: response regulator [Phycisphaerales bacterium]|nr:MAG: response regulator [Phycisphaerales bacterium]
MNENKTILVVDDEQKVLDLIAFRLKLVGYRVITAKSGEEGLTLAETDRPDLIILDITMPGLDGLTVCSRFKQSQTLSEIPILMLTARYEVESVNKAMAAGADDYVVKPYDPTVLQMKIQQHLGKSKVSSTESKGKS